MLALEDAYRVPSVRDWRQPTATLLYRLYSRSGELLYVGVTMRRLSERFNGHSRTHPWWPDVFSVHVAEYPKNHIALSAERSAIANERPRYNKRSASGVAPEPLRNLDQVSNESFATSRARADQGTREHGSGSMFLEMEMEIQDQVQTSPRRISSRRFGFGIQP